MYLYQFPPLSRIDILFCKQITDIFSSAVPHGCPHLRTVNLSRCEQITDMGVSALANRCPLLRYINIAHCQQITDIGISALLTNCRFLHSINISGYKFASRAFRFNLHKEYPRLSITYTAYGYEPDFS